MWIAFFIVFFTSSNPKKNICKTVHNLPIYSGLYIESYLWICEKSIHRHKDTAIHHCTSVHSSCLSAKHQNSVSILFNVSVLTQGRKQPFIVPAERPYQTALYTCHNDSAIVLHLHDDLNSAGMFIVENNFFSHNFKKKKVKATFQNKRNTLS